MSDKTIRVGDLVMVVKPRQCGCDSTLGHVFRVRHIRPGDYPTCATCGKYNGSDGVPIAEWDDGSGVSELSRLIKIDPPALPESVTTDEVITA